MDAKQVKRLFRNEIQPRFGERIQLTGRTLYLPVVGITLSGIHFDPSSGGKSRAYVQPFTYVLARQKNRFSLTYGQRLKTPAGTRPTWDLTDPLHISGLLDVIEGEVLPELLRRQDTHHLLKVVEEATHSTRSTHEYVDRGFLLIDMGRTDEAVRSFEIASENARRLNAERPTEWIADMAGCCARLADDVLEGRLRREEVWSMCVPDIEALKLLDLAEEVRRGFAALHSGRALPESC